MILAVYILRPIEESGREKRYRLAGRSWTLPGADVMAALPLMSSSSQISLCVHGEPVKTGLKKLKKQGRRNRSGRSGHGRTKSLAKGITFLFLLGIFQGLRSLLVEGF